MIGTGGHDYAMTVHKIKANNLLHMIILMSSMIKKIKNSLQTIVNLTGQGVIIKEDGDARILAVITVYLFF